MDELLNKLTIVIPVYNDVKYIAKTINSCLTEAGRILLYDNASTDGSSEICSQYASEHMHVQHIKHEENIGAFENFKKPIFECETEYISLVGSHDMLSKSYSLPIIKRMEENTDAILAVGDIQHIDEYDNNLKTLTCSNWVDDFNALSPIERIGAAVTNLRDCFMFYGVFRTELLKKSWFDTPCLGFDRVLLVRSAGVGSMLYVPDSTFYARDFPNTRNTDDDKERRTLEIVGKTSKPLEKNLLIRNKVMAETALEYVKTSDDLSKAFKIIDKVNRRFQNRKYFQKIRAVKIAFVFIVLLILGFCNVV